MNKSQESTTINNVATEDKTNNVITENKSDNVVDKNDVATTGDNASIDDNKKTEDVASELSNVADEKPNNVVEMKREIVKVEDKKDELVLTHLNKDFIYDVMSTPSNSYAEYRLVTFVILWARRNHIKYEFDDYGNIYLTKGELAEGEFYPCVTAHLDTVQTKQKAYAQVGVKLKINTRVVGTTNKKHEIFVDGMGIGGDDKAGVAICLSMFSHVDKLKCALFLQEEVGCKGSEHMNTEWFKNVGYVMGYDSPDLNRAAYACSGVKLFSKDFYQTYMEEVCKEHGLTKFHSEPYTDVKVIREKTNIICMNFGTGYYGAHSATEYCVLEDMDTACRMGHALIKKIGNTEHKLEHNGSSYGWSKNAQGVYTRVVDEDDEFFKKLSGVTSTYGGYNMYDDDDYSGYYGGYSQYGGRYPRTSGQSGTSSTTNSSAVATKQTSNNDGIEMDTLKYITERYEEYIDDLKSKVQSKCVDLGVDFNEFIDIFSKSIKF